MAKCKKCMKLSCRIDSSDGVLYPWCFFINDCPDKELERECMYYEGKTNADRIRSMTDEELAEWLTTITTDAQKEVVESQCFVDYQWKEWLESEVEE